MINGENDEPGARRRRGPARDQPTPEPGSFAAAFAAAVAARGVTLAYLRERLDERGTPVSLATLSYWRSGRRSPALGTSRHAIEQLEAILATPTGALSGTLSPDRGQRPTLHVADVHWPQEHVRRNLEAVGLEGSLGVAARDLRHVVDVDETRCLVGMRISALYRATRDHVTGQAIVLTTLEPDMAEREFVATAGGRIGRTVADHEHGVYVAEFVFDHPLQRGEYVAIEYSVRSPGARTQYYELNLLRRTRQALIWVRFHPHCLPQRVETYRRLPAVGKGTHVDLDFATGAGTAVNASGPGVFGMRWTWPGDAQMPPTPGLLKLSGPPV